MPQYQCILPSPKDSSWGGVGLSLGMVCPWGEFVVVYVCRGVGLSGMGLSGVGLSWCGFVGVPSKEIWQFIHKGIND